MPLVTGWYFHSDPVHRRDHGTGVSMPLVMGWYFHSDPVHRRDHGTGVSMPLVTGWYFHPETLAADGYAVIPFLCPW